ncbi:ABC-type transporter, ATP-binding component [Thermococcus sp. 4557]|uniref:ABC transporter permease n=1 Tax=Thermococcus sp. (strain CGMCC 1.5172 / 4557) TaxID=1042877 RepID=UPI000219E8FF|nr:ABC transporter permease [Thermococcus sp. 4557]AEK72668.1 ABC-type transporter, ATP-binding component [Thermococcus sp. 4557]
MKARAIKAIIGKDLRETRRERMALFWIFVFPLMWITLLGGIWGGHNPPITVDVGVVYFNESAPFTAADIVNVMENVTMEGVHVFKVRGYPNESAGVDAVRAGRIDVLLVFPKGFGENVSSGLQAEVYAYFDRSDPQNYQIVSGVIKGFFSEFEKEMTERRLNITLGYMEKYVPANAMGNFTVADLERYMLGLTNPLELEEREVKGEAPSAIQFYVTSFIGIQFLFATMLMIGSGTLEEIEHGTLRRIAASPATAWDFLAGKMLSTFIVITVSIVIGIVYAKLVFGETIFPSALGWLIIFLAAVFSMSLGLAIAMGTRSIKATNAIVNLISMPLLFLAGIVVPASILPEWARPIANYFPLGTALKSLRLLELYHRPTSEVLPDVVWVALATLGMLFIAVILYNWAVKRLT